MLRIDSIISMVYVEEHSRVYVSMANGTIVCFSFRETSLDRPSSLVDSDTDATVVMDADTQLEILRDLDLHASDAFDVLSVPNRQPPRRPILHLSLQNDKAVSSLLQADNLLWCGGHGMIFIVDCLLWSEVRRRWRKRRPVHSSCK